MKNPTLRQILGATAPDALPASSTALLVIDFQDEYFTGALPIPNGADALRNAVELVDHADRSGWQVVHVMHVAPEGSPIFAINGATVGIHRDILPKPTHRLVEKEAVSVFASTDLADVLKRDGITHLVICGLMTHACVAGAARDAVPAGFDVTVAADACATRDIAVDAQLQVSHDVLHRAALAEISDTFGAVMNTRDILSLANR
ncbi:isochorismatase family protein [Burkholderia cenocepacia]|uniref:isochorismatase family protein n=1 Tax=Burkholderia cepacia complex TaxID=87882 RepID=UPI00098EAA41|nr:MULTISPECIES: isochorismatase family protein [Burkholderia cepacia complex]AQT51974.1 cysteine hydrolase [Burkholderia cenocepacia]MBR8398821.1 isochorismatase family protein [Burkholderia cenocepacia]MDN7533407.1 isochorismatase family protein [Burkholderia orbicola]